MTPPRTGRYVVMGVVGILVGIVAIVLQDAYKLDVKTALTGGAFLKDGYRHALMFGGATLIVLGILLVVLGAINTASAKSRTALFALTVTLSLVTIAAGGLAVAAMKVKQHDAQVAPNTGLTAPDPGAGYQGATLRGEATGDGAPVFCGSGGCLQDGEPVYAVVNGHPCIARGARGQWHSNTLGNEFTCVDEVR